MRWYHRWRRSDAISHLYALRKKELYIARGMVAFVHHGIFPNDDPWEVYVIPDEVECPTCRGRGHVDRKKL